MTREEAVTLPFLRHDRWRSTINKKQFVRTPELELADWPYQCPKCRCCLPTPTCQCHSSNTAARMVVIHVKKTETDQFLYVTTCSASNDAVIRELVSCIACPFARTALAAPHTAGCEHDSTHCPCDGTEPLLVVAQRRVVKCRCAGRQHRASMRISRQCAYVACACTARAGLCRSKFGTCATASAG